MALLIVDPQLYGTFMSVVDVLRFVAILAIALLSWVAFRVTRKPEFAFTGAGFMVLLLSVASRALAIMAFDANAECLGCHGLGEVYGYYFGSIALFVIGAALVALAYIKRYSWAAVAVSSVLALAAVRLAVLSFVTASAVIAFIFGFIAVRAFESIRRSRRAIPTAAAFAVLSLSFVCESLIPFSQVFFPVGEIIGLIGFLILAYVILRVWL